MNENCVVPPKVVVAASLTILLVSSYALRALQEVQTFDISGEDVPPYAVRVAFLGEVSARIDREDENGLRKMLAALGIPTEGATFEAVRSAGIGRDDVYANIPAHLRNSVGESEETANARSRFIQRELGYVYGTFLTTANLNGVDVNEFEKRLREYFVDDLGLTISTDNRERALALEGEFRFGLRQVGGVTNDH